MRATLLTLFLLFAIYGHSQTDLSPTDLLESAGDTAASISTPPIFNSNRYPLRAYSLLNNIVCAPSARPHYDTNIMSSGDNSIQRTDPGLTTFRATNNVSFYASGQHNHYPGLMSIESGQLGIKSEFGSFTLQGQAIANKYGYFRGLTTQYGLEGELTYRFSQRLSINAFGTFFFSGAPHLQSGLPLPPSMLGYYGVSTFGAQFDYKINNNFGVMVGGQMVQRVGTNRYRFEPIATPYFKVGKIGIGLPVGQIMSGMMQEAIERRNHRHRLSK